MGNIEKVRPLHCWSGRTDEKRLGIGCPCRRHSTRTAGYFIDISNNREKLEGTDPIGFSF